MNSVRDEFSKVVDVRIPPNGYRKYVKELSRTGAFGQLQHENTLLILLEAVDELQQQIESIKSTDDMIAYTGAKPMSELGELICETCGRVCASAFGLQAHKRSHEKRSVSETTTKQ